MLFDTGGIVFEVELIAAQSVFLYACPKRKKFWLRFILSFMSCVVLSYFFPRYDISIGSFYLTFRSFVILAYSVGLTYICYDLRLRSAISVCVAGYAVQHIAYQSAFLISRIPGAEVLNNKLFGFIMYRELITMPVTFFLAWLLLGRKAAESGYFLDSDIRLDMISIFTVCVCTVMTRISYGLCGYDSVPPRIFLIMCCALALIIQFACVAMLRERADREVVEHIREEEKKQYELSKKMIETINVKCHDLKFKYGESKILQDEKKEVKEAVDIYDGMTRSGNDVLDVVLTENFLCCFSQGIKFTFMGSGDYVSFLSASDIYSLFGNALENAREAVAALNDDKKIISLTLSKKGQFVSVDVSNYFDGKISLNDSGCVVTKKDRKSVV